MWLAIDTASWTDKSVIRSGRFCPPKSNTPEARLRYYASQLPIVEVDSSYYAMPSPQVAQLWAERTPPDFAFNIKAFRLSPAQVLGPVAKKNVMFVSRSWAGSLLTTIAASARRTICTRRAYRSERNQSLSRTSQSWI
jgi:Protein of unknown function DUF72